MDNVDEPCDNLEMEETGMPTGILITAILLIVLVALAYIRKG